MLKLLFSLFTPKWKKEAINATKKGNHTLAVKIIKRNKRLSFKNAMRLFNNSFKNKYQATVLVPA